MADLYPHQRRAVEQMRDGCLLVGGVGTGKSRTALAYYTERVCEGRQAPPLYIITTARKRDTKDWEKEAEDFGPVNMHVDSWNNIQKYVEVEGAFFIFDEQRLVGTGKWAKAFQKIARRNRWILLTATPGDCWNDYAQVFIANGFFRNLADFRRRHVIYSPYVTKFPKIEGYTGIGELVKCRKEITVNMEYRKQTVPHEKTVFVDHDREMVRLIFKTRWDPFKEEPIGDAGALCYVLRRAVNENRARIEEVEAILKEHPKAVIFYNFNYELDALKEMAERIGWDFAEWNGHRHEPIPKSGKWVYLVQYSAGAEGWNCIETDTMIFYSLNYSYKMMTQAAGRIDRLNTPYTDLYYYRLMTRATIDLAIQRAISQKRDFNAGQFSATA